MANTPLMKSLKAVVKAKLAGIAGSVMLWSKFS
jgi:hypothetical protein